MATLDVEVVAADRHVWSGEARFVKATTVEGEIGVMPFHSPLMALLASGDVEVEPVDGARIHIQAAGGFFSVDSNRVTIVADRASLVDSTVA